MCQGQGGSRLGWQRRAAEMLSQEGLSCSMGSFQTGQLRLLPAGVEGLWSSPPSSDQSLDVVCPWRKNWPEWGHCSDPKWVTARSPSSQQPSQKMGCKSSFLKGLGEQITAPSRQRPHLSAWRKSTGTTKGRATFNRVKIRTILNSQESSSLQCHLISHEAVWNLFKSGIKKLKSCWIKENFTSPLSKLLLSSTTQHGIFYMMS